MIHAVVTRRIAILVQITQPVLETRISCRYSATAPAMPKYKYIHVSEQQLEDLVRQHVDKLEDGLRYVHRQKAMRYLAQLDHWPMWSLTDAGKRFHRQ